MYKVQALTAASIEICRLNQVLNIFAADVDEFDVAILSIITIIFYTIIIIISNVLNFCFTIIVLCVYRGYTDAEGEAQYDMAFLYDTKVHEGNSLKNFAIHKETLSSRYSKI
jgi:hypothetical protein